MKTFRNAFQKVQKVFDALVSVCLIVMIAVVFLQTFCRFVIFYSLPWSEELSRYLFVALIVLGANLAITRKMFVRIEIIDNYLKGSAATALLFARKLVAIFVNTVFVYGSYKLMQIGSYQTSHGHPDGNVCQALPPFGCGMSCVHRQRLLLVCVSWITP